jgi:Carboxypeptidase regulatory-like domain
MRRVLLPLLSVLATAIFLVPGTAYAQGGGSIAGIARDTSGGVVPGVTVEVTSPALIEKVRSTTTDSNGRYQISALPVGTYSVTFTLTGFASVRRENVQVSSDFTAEVRAEMSVGDLKEVVSVVAEAPVVDVQNARVQQVFQGTDIANLPTQRDLPSLLILVPSLTSEGFRGVCSGGVGGFCNPTVPAFNSHTSVLDADGLNQGRVLVDGMVINGPRSLGFGNFGAASGIVVDTANVQEVSLTLSGSLGESETGGAAINIVPRTGGNRYAGNYFTSYTNTRLFDRNRKTRLSETPDTQEYNWDYDVTGAFGGPIKRDRLWFYLQARHRGDDKYPSGGTQPGFANLNEGVFGANYIPDRTQGWLTFGNAYRNAAIRLTAQATQKNKLNIYWDEQDACINPCYGMINIVDSPEAYFSLQTRPNRLAQLSWTNPYTNRMLFEAGLSMTMTHTDSTKHREFTNYRTIPRICESGTTVGRDDVAVQVNSSVTTTQGGSGLCNVFTTMNSGSINDQFPGGDYTLSRDRNLRSRASASYITGAHNAKLGYEGVYFAERIRNESNDMRLNYHYQTPVTTGTWNATNRSGNCYAAPVSDTYACGNMNLFYGSVDPTNTQFLRPKPVGFGMNTGVAETDERVWFGALFIQDQWTLNRFTINGALRYDHAESRYGETCVSETAFGIGTPWCSTPSKGVRYSDITPRWGVAWDVFGTGKTSIKWNMGKYLQAASLNGIYVDNNDARRSRNQMTRAWDDLNGNRIIDCQFNNHLAHTQPGGDFCGGLTQGNTTNPSTAFLEFGESPSGTQLFNPDSFCGRTENSDALHGTYCEAAGQNLMSGWNTRRNEWQFGLGVQHEVLPRLSAEVTYNRRVYGNLTDQDTLGRGCDYYDVGQSLGTGDQCFQNILNYVHPNYDFYSVTAPQHPGLPEGGGYVINGNDNQNVSGGLPDLGDVTTLRQELGYSWNGVDTNFVWRAPGGVRVSGGTSTGRSNRNTCFTDGEDPNVKGREGNDPACIVHNNLTTNVRANGSYTIPWVDVLMGVVFQYRPGTGRSANLTVPSTAVTWVNAARTGTQFNTGGGTSGTNTVNLLDIGDLYGEGMRLTDLTFAKNFRFKGKRVNVGVNVYNLFNSDAATSYNDNFFAWYDATTGQWSTEDNPSTTAFEQNTWGRVTGITTPRFARLQIQFDF